MSGRGPWSVWAFNPDMGNSGEWVLLARRWRRDRADRVQRIAAANPRLRMAETRFLGVIMPNDASRVAGSSSAGTER